MPDNPDNPDEDNPLLALRTQAMYRAFENQNRLNQIYRDRQLSVPGQEPGPQSWVEAEWPIYRAIWTETAEAINHTNWFWWKFGQYGKPMSKEQLSDLYVELCDILHFGLSVEYIRHIEPVNHLVAQSNLMAWAFGEAEEEMRGVCKLKLEPHLEQLVVEAIQHRRFSGLPFAKACASVGLSFEKLMFMYFGKTVLNEFRQQHGYAVNQYVKMWSFITNEAPKEDNFYLVEILDAIYADFGQEEALKLVGTEAFYSLVYTKLALKYRTRQNQ